jgi:cell wall-associated NlpC family hydrolase
MDPRELHERRRVEAIARSWLGTRYHSHARLKGVGVDCAQLLIGVYAEAGIIDAFDTGYYSEQFFLHRSEERFLELVTARSREIAEAEAKPADVVLYRFGRCWAHGAIIVSPGWPHAIIHAHSLSGCVMQCGGRDGELADPQRRPRFFTRW